MSLIKWDPFGMDEFFSDDFFRFPEVSRVGIDLAVDLFKDKNNLIVKMNVAGINPKDINISVEDNYLRIVGSRKEEKEHKNKDYYSKQISRGSFERIIPLPIEVNEDKVNAEFKDGVLKIVLPQKSIETKKKKKIDIKVKDSKKKLATKPKSKSKIKTKTTKKKK